MKLLSVLIIFTFGFQFLTQAFETNSTVTKVFNSDMTGLEMKTNWFRTEIVTNWINAPPSYRLVNGQLYDTRHSIYWGEVSDFISGLKSGGIYANLQVESIGKTSIICAVYENEKGIRPSGFPAIDETLSGAFIKRILIYHYPNQNELITGQLLMSCVAMRVENWKANGISLESYDCGLPVTNKIPVLKLVKVKIDPPSISVSSTNSP